MSAGAIRAGRAFYELFLEDSALRRGLRRVGRDVRNATRSVARVGVGVAGGVAAAVGVIAPIVRIGVDLETSTRRFRTLFGEQADAAEEWAERVSTALGRSRRNIQNAASGFRGIFGGLGFGADESTRLAQSLTELSIDFAAFAGLAEQDAFRRLLSGLSGSPEALDQFGVNLKEAQVQAELTSLGLGEITGAAEEQAKTLARLSLIYKSLTEQNAIGFAAENSDTLAESTKQLSAEIEKLGAAFADVLLPGLVEAVKDLTEFVQGIDDAADRVANFLAQFPALARALGIEGGVGDVEIVGINEDVLRRQRAAGQLEGRPELLALAEEADKAAEAQRAVAEAAERLKNGFNDVLEDIDSTLTHELFEEARDAISFLGDSGTLRADLANQIFAPSLQIEKQQLAVNQELLREMKAQNQLIRRLEGPQFN